MPTDTIMDLENVERFTQKPISWEFFPDSGHEVQAIILWYCFEKNENVLYRTMDSYEILHLCQWPKYMTHSVCVWNFIWFCAGPWLLFQDFRDLTFFLDTL